MQHSTQVAVLMKDCPDRRESFLGSFRAPACVGLLLFAMVFLASSAWAIDPLDVNTSDLDLSLEWGIHCMSSILNPQDRNIPYFECWVISRPLMRFHAQLSVGNVTGRALYALLMAERALGTPLDPDIVAKYRTVLLDSYQQVRGIPADPSTIGGPFDTCWIFNNGAGMRGLLGLVQFRNDPTATEYFNESLSNYEDHFAAPGYSWLAFQQSFGLVGGGTGGSPAWPGPSSSNVRAFPFATWSISRYFDVSGSSLAYDLASDFGQIHLSYDFPLDGSLGSGDHGFEIAGKMSALAQVADMLNDSMMKDRVRAFYDKGLRSHMSQTGWFPERLSNNSDVGEINNTCEIIQTALHLGDWGWPQYYQDAERFTRAHLLPTQLLDNSFVPDNTAPPTPDSYYDVKGRSKGAYGFPAPYGHVATKNPYFSGAFFFDIVAGGIAEVAEVKMNCWRKVNGNHCVNLLFDLENEEITTVSPYPQGDTLRVTLKTPGNLFVRLSDWVARSSLSVVGGGVPLPFTLSEHYLEVPGPPIGEEISIHLPLPIYETTETLNGRVIEMMWRGDSLIAMSQMETTLPYFEDIGAARRRLWIESLGEDALALSSPLDGNGVPDTGELVESVGVLPDTDRRGQDARAIRLDGQTSRLRYALPFFPVEDYTLIIWVRPEGSVPGDDSLRQIVSAWSGSYDDPLRITLVGHTLFAGLEHGVAFKTSGHELEDGRWYQIAVVKKGTSLTLCRDGVQLEQIEVPGQLESQAKDIGIGYNPHFEEGEHFAGLLDEVKLFARAMTAEEIAEFYQQEVESSVGAFAYYR